MDRRLCNGYAFIVFEFLPGGTPYELIKSRDRIPGPEILSSAEQVAAGIDYAHSQGRIHRDITPSNILSESDSLGRVAITAASPGWLTYTGRSAFPEAENIYELFQVKLHRDVPRLRTYRTVPEELDMRHSNLL
jgi:serine/threonine protein kinase